MSILKFFLDRVFAVAPAIAAMTLAMKMKF